MVNILSAVPSGLFSFFNSSRHLLRYVPGYSHSRLRRSVEKLQRRGGSGSGSDQDEQRGESVEESVDLVIG